MWLKLKERLHGAYEFPQEFRSIDWEKDYIWARNFGVYFCMDFQPMCTRFLPFYVRKDTELYQSNADKLILYTRVYFTDIEQQYGQRRNNYMMAGHAINKGWHNNMLYELKDGKRSCECMRNRNKPTLTVYSTDKRRPCEHTIVTTSSTAYYKLLLLLYANNYSYKHYDEYKVILYRGGVYFNDIDYSDNFWKLVQGSKTVHFFIPDYDVISFDAKSVPFEVHICDYLDIDGMAKLAELLHYCRTGSIV